MKRSQTDRILARLRHAGRTTQLEWLAPTVDGGPQILRVPARIDELRKRGHRIESTRRPGRVALYRLVGEPATEATPSVEVVASAPRDGALFGAEVGTPAPPGPYEVDR